MNHPVWLMRAGLRLELGLTAGVETFLWATRVKPFAQMRAQICMIVFRLVQTTIPSRVSVDR
jgi:hypothetical protein